MAYRRRLLFGALVGASLGLLLLFSIASTNPNGVGSAVALLLPIGRALFGAAAVSSYEGSKPFHLQEWVPLTPGKIRHHATRWYASAGWTMTGGTNDALSFTRGGLSDPNAGCLLLLGFLPFLLMAQPRQITTIQTMPTEDGTLLEIVVSSCGAGGRATAARFFNSLHHLR